MSLVRDRRETKIHYLTNANIKSP